MLNKTQKIAISKNFIISLLFLSLMFAAFGLTLEDTYAADFNEDGSGLTMELNTEDKLENSQTDELLEVDTDSGDILTANYVVEGRTFQDIQNKINGATAGDTIILVGDYYANGAESTVNITKRLTITSTSTATLNGEGVSGIFAVDNRAPGTVISNLKFINAEKDEASALFINAKDVVVDNCYFEDNHANHGGVLQSRYNLYIAENVTVKNCNFTRNTGYYDDLENFSNAGAVGLFGINSKVINCIFDSNWVKSKYSAFGGALQIGMDEPNYKALVYKCTFINNYAVSLTGDSHGGAGCVRNGVEYIDCLFINNSAAQGGALTFHASGKLQNCTFINNTATDLYGGAVSTGYLYETMEMKINDCYFEGNDAPKGGAIQALGLNIDIIDSDFLKNHADTDGGALNIEALNVKVTDSNFNSNVAEVDGGAIYTKGSDTVVSRSNFVGNEARPDYNKLDDGLGGAIYINSTQANVENSRFYYNTARNGSAIYYDKYGNGLTLRGNTLFENQAWVYHLPVYAHDIYYGETEHLKSVIHGGNNIAKYNNLAVSNAIYNAADYSKLSIDGEYPVSGATNSGRLYQDDREYNMEIQLTVKKEDGTVVYDRVLNSNYLGDVSDDLNNLQPGKYYVTARHIEDTYYKAITNTTTFTVIPKVDNQIKKSAASETYNYGDIVVWTLNVTNNGPNRATNVNVTDVLPNGMIYIDNSAGSKYNPSTGLLNIGNLDVGASVIVKIYAQVNKTGTIVNNADVTAKEFDVDLSNNHDQAGINVPSTIDLEVKKYVNNSNPNYGDSIKWTVVVKNNGPDVAHNVKVTDVLPNGLTAVTSDGNYNARTGIWDIGTLGLNDEVRLNIFCRVSATGTIKNDVSVKGQEVDRNMSNNYDSESISIRNASDLAIDKSIDVSKANYTDEIAWNLVIVNNGPDDATGVKITDVLPDGLTYVRSVLPRGTYSDGIIDVGGLAVGERLTYKIICKVGKTGTIVNVASIKGNEYDYDMSNNRDDASVYINPAADLEVIKTVSNSNPRYHDCVTWTITVKNNGPDIAHDIVMSDLLPKSLVWKNDTGNGRYDHVAGKWTIGELSNGGSASLNIVAWVNATGTIRNDASVSGREHDYNPSNNRDSEIINVNNSCDLAIDKSIDVSRANYTDEIAWNLVIVNNGPDDATSVKITDVLPNGLTYVRSVLPRGTYSDGVIDVGGLAVGERLAYKIICKVGKTGTIVNVASIKGNEYDYDMSNNRDDASVYINPAADLEVIKTVSNSNPRYHDEVTWTITVKNNGPDIAHDVVMSDLLPRSAVWKSDTGNGKYNHVDGKWTIGELANGGSVRLNIVAWVNATGTIKNDASVKGREHDYNPSNNKDSETIMVNNSCDLAIDKSIDVSRANYTDEITWKLVITNNGPDKATGVKVTDVLPNGLSYVKSVLPKGTYSNGVIDVGELAVGERLTYKIICKVGKTGTIVNVASIKGNEYDYDMSNNRDDASVYINPAADLEVIKTVSNSNPRYHDCVTWTITVKNNGPDIAHDVVMSDLLPESLVWKNDTGNGRYDHVAGKWTIGELRNGGSVSLNIVAWVNATGTIRNDASVSGREHDYNPSNNKDSETIRVNDACDLAIDKSIDVSKANYTDEIAWNLVIVNNGPDDATGVKVTDVLPEGLVYVSSVLPRGTYSNGVIDVGGLAVGERLTYKIICKVNKTGTILNVASVKGNEYDYDMSNNRDDASVYIAPASDLEVIKTVNVSNPNYNDCITWSIVVKNNGPDVAHDVVVSDLLPKSMIWISDTGNGNYNHDTGKWTIGELRNGGSVRLNIVTRVNATGITQNNASVTGHEFDYNPSNNRDNASVDVPKAADVSVVKLVNNSNPSYWDIIKWTVIAKNNGPDKATSVSVDDILPDGLVLLDVNVTKGIYDNGVWAVCCLEKGEEQRLEITCLVNKTGHITNIASITAEEYDLNKSNNRDDESIDVPLTVDLEVVKEVSNASPFFGESITWMISVKNNGPDMATNVVLYDLLDDGLIYSDYSSTVGVFDGSKWNIGSLNRSHVEYINITCIANKLGDIINTAFANSSEVDRNKSNNNDSAKITVYPLTDLAVVKLVNNSNPNYLDLVKWYVIVSNNGPNSASGVVVKDIMPKGLELVYSSEYIDEIGNWYVGNLGVNEARELDIISRVTSTGVFRNVVIVSGSETDPYLDNNENYEVINVAPASDLAITKTVSKYYYKVGDAIDYSIKIVNNGPDEAKNVKVDEILDSSLILKSFKATKGSYDEQNQKWEIDELGNGESAELFIRAMASGEGIVKNMVSATSDTFDYNMKNNNASVSVNVSDVPNKTGDNIVQNGNLAEIESYLPEMHVTGNPFVVLLISVVFSIAFLGRNFSKKR